MSRRKTPEEDLPGFLNISEKDRAVKTPVSIPVRRKLDWGVFTLKKVVVINNDNESVYPRGGDIIQEVTLDESNGRKSITLTNPKGRQRIIIIPRSKKIKLSRKRIYFPGFTKVKTSY